jgi:hypothetical protein
VVPSRRFSNSPTSQIPIVAICSDYSKMKRLKNIFIILLFSLTLVSCRQTKKKQQIEQKELQKQVEKKYDKIISDSTNKINDKNKITKQKELELANPLDLESKYLVDYKSETYKIFIGENYKLSDQIIDWQWAYLNDPDDKIDSSGKDEFLFLGEPLLKYNKGEWLPSLHIKTNKNIITSFLCSILFDITGKGKKETMIFLKLLSNDIKQLKQKKVINSIVEYGVYEKATQNYIETFKLTKAKGNEDDRFEYSVKLKLKNGS